MNADRGQIARFIGALFKYAAPGNFVSLRAFTHSDKPIGMYRGTDGKSHFPCVCIGDGLLDRDSLIDHVTKHATFVANYHEPSVFCPPVATFDNDQHARGQDLAEGLTLSIECDQRPYAARAELELLLGPATIVVASGGIWTDTGKQENKLHLHWRLTDPTRDGQAHQRLRLARRYATALVGADTSNIHAVHPIRWPGSWHKKAEPRLAEIITETDNEIDLDAALLALSPDDDAGGEVVSPSRTEDHWHKLAAGVDSGTTGRISAVISIFGYLLRIGCEPHLAVTLAHDYNIGSCRPSLSKEKVDAALVSIMEREETRS
jgi:hypothetical protein